MNGWLGVHKILKLTYNVILVSLQELNKVIIEAVQGWLDGIIEKAANAELPNDFLDKNNKPKTWVQLQHVTKFIER